jgi:hypothetical protein
MPENGKFLIETGEKQVEERVVAFGDLEEGSEFRLVANFHEE